MRVDFFILSLAGKKEIQLFSHYSRECRRRKRKKKRKKEKSSASILIVSLAVLGFENFDTKEGERIR